MKEFYNKIVKSDHVNLFLSFFRSSEMSLSSIAVAYYLLLSLFPMLLIIGNALPFFNLNVNEILSWMQENMPLQLYDVSADLVKGILSEPNTGLLSVSVLVALWTFSRALSSVQMAMNKAYGVSDHRDFIISRVIGLIVGVGILLVLYAGILLTTFGEFILQVIHNHFPFDDNVFYFLEHMSLPAVALIVFGILILLYAILPNVKIKKIRYVVPGALFSTFVLVFLTSIIASYISRGVNQLQDVKLAGSLVVFALMLWFIFIARVLILGAILNAIYQQRKEGEIEMRRGEIVKIIKDIRKEAD